VAVPKETVDSGLEPRRERESAPVEAHTLEQRGHARWVRAAHWLLAASVLTLAVSGFVVLMAHPRLYWGKAGNEWTRALFELPISRNYHAWTGSHRLPFFDEPNSPYSIIRTYDIFNENGWARSLHFLSAWLMTLTGALYVLLGLLGGHVWRDLTPKLRELSPARVWQDVTSHLRLQIKATRGGPPYSVLQKCSYFVVLFIALPLMVVTGLAMSPAVSAAYPFLSELFGGSQSSRTIHFFTFVALLLFVLVHVAMVILSGFRRQMRAMTFGN
jgi:thiosulfate reductase cytochrome b subunit